MKITFKSQDPRAMDAFVREVIVAVKSAGGSVAGPVPLPTRSSGTAPKANTYLGSLVRDSVATHLRALVVTEVSAKVKAALEALKAPGVVDIYITD